MAVSVYVFVLGRAAFRSTRRAVDDDANTSPPLPFG
jgi:hypothetical protein